MVFVFPTAEFKGEGKPCHKYMTPSCCEEASSKPRTLSRNTAGSKPSHWCTLEDSSAELPEQPGDLVMDFKSFKNIVLR